MISIAMNRIRELLSELFGPTSKFRVGDGVELLEGGNIMLVVEVISEPGMPEPIIYCQWYESKTKSTKTKFLPEKDLKQINWYQ